MLPTTRSLIDEFDRIVGTNWPTSGWQLNRPSVIRANNRDVTIAREGDDVAVYFGNKKITETDDLFEVFSALGFNVSEIAVKGGFPERVGQLLTEDKVKDEINKLKQDIEARMERLEQLESSI